MHWIFVWINIWIELAVAPYLVGLVLSMTPLFLWNIFEFLRFGALTQEIEWAFLVPFSCGFAPYVSSSSGELAANT